MASEQIPVTTAARSNAPKAFVCGWPIEHSKSPLIHGFWLQQFGIEGSYERVAVPPEDIERFVSQLRESGFAGGNVTIPHKEAVIDLVDRLNPAAEAIGAVNTLWFDGDQLVGGNTDWIGFAENLDQSAPAWSASADNKTAIVIGAGGAARGVLYALLKRGFKNIILGNRTLKKAEKLVSEFAEQVDHSSNIRSLALSDLAAAMNGADFLVNTTNMGMTGSPPMPEDILEACEKLAPDAVVNDIVYAPLETPLLAASKKAGRKSVDGLGMLLHQAAPGFEKWFGGKPEVTDALRQAVLNPQVEKPKTGNRPVILGLTGSIGMGKSTTAQMFRDEGIPVHDADAVVHELYAGKAAPLVEAVFPGVVKNGVVDRSALGPFVIGKPQAMKQLEAIIHPLVAEARNAFIEKAASQGHDIVVLDIPLLFETGGEKHCDKVVVVTASPEEQRRRVLAREGMTVEKFEAILNKQVPDSQKREKADYIIDTGEGLDGARRQVKQILSDLAQDRKNMREIIFDTETTGFRPEEGERIIEIGAIEFVNRSATGRTFHEYINPEGKEVNPGAFEVHGISNEFLIDKRTFTDLASEFLEFIGSDSILVAHNAPFDINFLNHEFARLNLPPVDPARVVDTLELARKKHPMAQNSLDRLCDRYGINNKHRTLHGALLDSELLSEVYIELLGGRQATLELVSEETTAQTDKAPAAVIGSAAQQRPKPLPSRLSESEKAAHEAFVESLGEDAIWKRYI